MARIDLQGLAHGYAGRRKRVIGPLDLVFEDGGAYALLGPAGCGKTTLLGAISGLIAPSQGRVLFDGYDITDLAPERRNAAQVFAEPAVYETLTVYRNLAFPLRNRGSRRSEIDARVRDIADVLGLTDDLARRAGSVDAETKQKIALGRGLVRPDVAALLFDNPLGTLDDEARWRMQTLLKTIQDRYEVTMIYATRDPGEAFTFADTVAAMVCGQVVQFDTPEEIAARPRHTAIAGIVGRFGMNLIGCRIEGGEAIAGEVRIPLAGEIAAAAEAAGAGDVEIAIQPEFVTLHSRQAKYRVRAAIDAVEDLGHCRLVTARLGDAKVLAAIEDGAPVPDHQVWLEFSPAHTLIYRHGELVEATP